MASRLNDMAMKAIDESKKDDIDLRSMCDAKFHECVLNTIRTGLDCYAKEGNTKTKISISQMNLVNTCHTVAQKVMTDYVKKNPVVEGVRLSSKMYFSVEFDWSKPKGGFFSTS